MKKKKDNWWRILPLWLKFGLILMLINLPYTFFPDSILDGRFDIILWMYMMIPLIPFTFEGSLFVIIGDYPIPNTAGLFLTNVLWFGIGALIGLGIMRIKDLKKKLKEGK